MQRHQRVPGDVQQPGGQTVMLHLHQIIQMGATAGEILRTADQQLIVHAALVFTPARAAQHRRNQQIVGVRVPAEKQAVPRRPHPGQNVAEFSQ